MNLKEIANLAQKYWTSLGNSFLEYIKPKDYTFISYLCEKYTLDKDKMFVFIMACMQVKAKGKIHLEELLQIQSVGIPLGLITGFNLSGFRESTTPVPYDIFVGYLVNMCDGKFTKEQIKQTIL